jgi:hypothetical protein
MENKSLEKKPSGSIRTYAGTIFLVITMLKQAGFELPIEEKDVEKILVDGSQFFAAIALAYGLAVNWIKRIKSIKKSSGK